MKWLITGDVHIHNYKPYNHIVNRLDQFKTLFTWVGNTMAEKGVNALIIAGDLFMVPSPPPKVVNTAKECLISVLAKNPKAHIFMIPGNHDIDLKKHMEDIENYSLLNLFDDERIHVYTDSLVSLGGKMVHFHGWTPNGIVPREADILIAHDDIAGAWYNKVFSEHGIDTSSYHKAFVGHIHNPQVIDNAYIPGSPIPHNLGDNQDCSFLLYDTETDTVERIPTGCKYLKFIKVTDESQIPEGELIAAKVINKMDNIEMTLDKNHLTSNILDVAKSLVPEEFSSETKEILNKIIEEAKYAEEHDIDLDIELGKASITNFLSIHSLDFDFTELGRITSIIGENGAGKSTLFKFLFYMFTGSIPGALKDDVISNGKDSFKGELTFTYKGTPYRIVRERGKKANLEFYVNGNLITKNTSNEVEGEIKQHLTFLPFLNILFIFQESKGIFSEMNESSRVSFLSNFIGMPMIDKMTNDSQQKIIELNDKAKALKSETDYLRGAIYTINSELGKSSEDIDYTVESPATLMELDQEQKIMKELEDKIAETKEKQEALSREFSSIAEKHLKANEKRVELTNQHSKYQSQRDALKDVLEGIENSIVTREESISHHKTNLETSKTLLESYPERVILELQQEVEQAVARQTSLNEQLLQLTRDSAVFQGELARVSSLKNEPKCPTCQSHIEGELLNSLMNQESEYSAKLEDAKKLLDTQTMELQTIKGVIEEKNKIILQFTSERTRLLTEIENRSQQLGADTENLKQLSINKASTTSQIIQLEKDLLDTEDKLSLVQEEWNSARMEMEQFDYEARSKVFTDELVDLSDKRRVSLDRINKLKSKFECIEKIGTSLKTLEVTTVILDEMNKFTKKVLTDKGLLVAHTLQNLSEYLNSEELKVTTIKTLKQGTIAPTLDIALYVKEFNTYIPYNRLSGGQALLADLYFLKGLTKLTKSIGFIFMDELFKFFDSDNITLASEILRDTNVKKTLLIIHDQSATSIADNLITVSLTENGSQYQLQ